MTSKKVYIVVCNTCAYVPFAICGTFDQLHAAIAYRNKLNEHFKGYRRYEDFKGYRMYEIIKQTLNVTRELRK